MNYSLSQSLSRSGAINPDGLSLDLAFAADKTLTARKGPTPTFTRASTATFVGSDGLIQSAAINEARFDHDPVTLACKGLLIEEARTNLSLQSGVIVNNSGWDAINVTAAVSGTGPDGNNAYQISEEASTAFHALVNLGGTGAANATSVVSGTNYTGSIFVKKVLGSVDWVQLTFGFAGFGSVLFANFNIGNGTIGNYTGLTSGTVPRIEQFPNGWYRISITAPATATTASTGNTILAFTNNTDSITRLPSYLGSISNEVLTSLWQFETGLFPTSYIPTTTAALTRSADVCSITGGDFTSFYNQSEGTVVTGYSSFADSQVLPSNRGITMSDGTTANRVAVANIPDNYTSAGLSMVFLTSSGGASVAILGETGLDTTTLNTISGAYKVNDFASSTNGSAVVTDTSGAAPVGINKIDIGNQFSSEFLNGHIASVRYFKKRLPDAKLQTLTT